MSKVIFNVGDKVRSIHQADCNFNCVGVVEAFRRNAYEVVFADKSVWYYAAEYAHEFLEKVTEYSPAHIKPLPPERKLIKRDRINVINGKTQDEMVTLCGHAVGVQQFNTRCLGRTTGQAFLAIGQAMCNPGTEIRISKVDHAKEHELCSTSWRTLDKNFRGVLQSLIGDLKGFSFTDTHLVYHPIQTVETYVEYKQ